MTNPCVGIRKVPAALSLSRKGKYPFKAKIRKDRSGFAHLVLDTPPMPVQADRRDPVEQYKSLCRKEGQLFREIQRAAVKGDHYQVSRKSIKLALVHSTLKGLESLLKDGGVILR